MSIPRILNRSLRVAACLGFGAALLPCRLTSATLKIIPVVGHAAATPFDMCASAID